MATQVPTQISLRAFGYSIFVDVENRQKALERACDQHGVEPVLARLEQVKNLNSNPDDGAGRNNIVSAFEQDIRYILSKHPTVEQVEETPTFVHATTVEDEVDKMKKLNEAFDEFLVRDGPVDTPVQIAIRAFQETTLVPSIQLAENQKHENQKKKVLDELERVRKEVLKGNVADLEDLENYLSGFGSIWS